MVFFPVEMSGSYNKKRMLENIPTTSLWRSKNYSRRESDGETLILDLWRIWSISSLLLFLSFTVKVYYMSQIELNHFQIWIAESAGTVEYTDCTTVEG